MLTSIKNINEIQLKKIAEVMAIDLPKQLNLYLLGDLGAGKTTFVRYFLQSLGYTDLIKSPTYTIVETYLIQDKKINHFDLYRLIDPEELSYIGIHDYFSSEAINLIEWPEKGKAFLPECDLEIKFQIETEKVRELIFKANSRQGEEILKQIKEGLGEKNI